jgi:hypothetical protein
VLVCPETGDRTTSAMPRPHRHDMSLAFIPQAYTGRSRSGYVSPSAGFCRLQREYCGDQPHSGSRTEPATDAAIHPSDRYRIRQSVDDRQQRRRNIQRHTWLSILALVPVLSTCTRHCVQLSCLSVVVPRKPARPSGSYRRIRPWRNLYHQSRRWALLSPNSFGGSSAKRFPFSLFGHRRRCQQSSPLAHRAAADLSHDDQHRLARCLDRRCRGTSRGPRRVNTPSPALDREGPSCSPGGRYLAYYEGNPVGRGSPLPMLD